jgi:hypothetical protein
MLREIKVKFVAFEDVGWGVEVLIEGLLAAKWPITILTLVHWCVNWGIQVLLQCSLTTEVLITTLTVLGHFARTIAST